MEPLPTTQATEFCRAVLPSVSRTFALNIPLLPPPLDRAVTVAYLLCRIADTLEDEVPGEASAGLLAELAHLAALPEGWEARARRFSGQAEQVLRAQAPAAQVRLVAGCTQVLEALALLPPAVQQHVAQCVATMAHGMGRMGARGRAGSPSGLGLRDLKELREYCYYVAGTVGELLTRLFMWYSPAVAARRELLEPRAVPFADALQLTNILKDVREDLERGSCWLPRTLLAEHELVPERLLEPRHLEQALAAHGRLVAEAHADLREAFAYALALPRRERGLRLFCLWPLLLAALTLRKLYLNPAVFTGPTVKVTRHTVRRVVRMSRLLVGWDGGLRVLFESLTWGLPRPAPAYAGLSLESTERPAP